MIVCSLRRCRLLSLWYERCRGECCRLVPPTCCVGGLVFCCINRCLVSCGNAKGHSVVSVVCLVSLRVVVSTTIIQTIGCVVIDVTYQLRCYLIVVCVRPMVGWCCIACSWRFATKGEFRLLFDLQQNTICFARLMR